jgi:hypothetical protein
MSVPSQNALWSFAPQPAKIGEGGTFTPGSLSWYKFKAARVGLGTIDDTQIFPPEVGGSIVPTGSFKQAGFYGGDVDIIPRLEEVIGWLLYAAMGSVSTVTGVDSDGDAVAGLNTHIFSFSSASNFYLPWLASRVHFPGVDTSNDSGEYGYDCKIGSLQITVPQMGKVAMRMGMVGRQTQYDAAPDAWTYANSWEDTRSTPDAGRGIFKLGGDSFPALGLQMNLINQLSAPRDEFIVGSFHPDDIIPLTRGMSLRFVYKYVNDDLARLIQTGAVDGTEWSSLPYDLVTAGADYALDTIFSSPMNVPSLSVPYRLRVRCNRVNIAKDGGTMLVAGAILQESYTVTPLEPLDGSPFAQIIIENAETAYNWPT